MHSEVARTAILKIFHRPHGDLPTQRRDRTLGFPYLVGCGEGLPKWLLLLEQMALSAAPWFGK